MVKAGDIRTCAYEGCRDVFTPRDGRQRYCDQSCSANERQRRNRASNCAHCGKPITELRFCDKACRSAYITERRGKRGKRVVEPVAVLLPSGCNPSPLRLSELPRAYGEVARKLFCRRLERCLSYAVSKRWGGMSCANCDVEEPDVQAPRPKGTNWEW